MPYYFINIIMNNSTNQASWIYLWVPALGFCYEITRLLLLNYQAFVTKLVKLDPIFVEALV